MSSHHIVRENQEPALLIDDLFLINEENLGQLLEWSPTVIIENNTVDALDARGYKFDIVFAQTNSDRIQENVKIVPYSATNFLEASLSYLIEQHYQAVNIVTDEIELRRYEPYLDHINVVLFMHDMRYSFVSNGFTKWKPGGERIYIDGVDADIGAEGLKKIRSRIYETTKDGLFKLEFSKSSYILIGETIL